MALPSPAGYDRPDWGQPDKVIKAAESGAYSESDAFSTYVADDDLQAPGRSGEGELPDH